jgi:hypothetical protein
MERPPCSPSMGSSTPKQCWTPHSSRSTPKPRARPTREGRRPCHTGRHTRRPSPQCILSRPTRCRRGSWHYTPGQPLISACTPWPIDGMETVAHAMNSANTTEAGSRNIVLGSDCSRERWETPREAVQFEKRMESCRREKYFSSTRQARRSNLLLGN